MPALALNAHRCFLVRGASEASVFQALLPAVTRAHQRGAPPLQTAPKGRVPGQSHRVRPSLLPWELLSEKVALRVPVYAMASVPLPVGVGSVIKAAHARSLRVWFL